MENNKKGNSVGKTLLVIIVLLIAIFSIWKLLNKNKPVENNETATSTSTSTATTTQNDPVIPQIPSNWLTQNDTTNNLSFKYPKDFGLTYVHPVDWPPKVAIQNKSFTCNEAGNPVDRAGATKIKVINGHTYCVTEVQEGAAGSTYTNYAYNTMLGSKNVMFTFSIRKPQCMNYDEPNQTNCKNEQASFDVDKLIDQVIYSTTFK